MRAAYLTPPQVAAELQVSKQTVLRAIHAGLLIAVQLGPQTYRITRADLDRYLEARRTGDHLAARRRRKRPA